MVNEDKSRWYCAMTDRYREMDAAERIRNQGFEVLSIMEEYQITRRGITSTAQRSLFRGYIFTRFNKDREQWRKINSSHSGGIRLITTGGRDPMPIPIVESQMNRLLEWVGSDGIFRDPTRDTTEPWKELEGQFVRIIDGPFTGYSGLCRKSEAGRVQVLLTMFVRASDVDFGWKQVEKVG